MTLGIYDTRFGWICKVPQRDKLYENHLNEWRKEGEKEGHKRANIKKKMDVNSVSSSEGEPLCRHALKFNMM